jgi:hypothetical protein
LSAGLCVVRASEIGRNVRVTGEESFLVGDSSPHTGRPMGRDGGGVSAFCDARLPAGVIPSSLNFAVFLHFFRANGQNFSSKSG